MSMISDYATENYLKVIVKALAAPGKERIGTGEIARLIGVTPGTSTIMVKKLERDGFLNYESHKGCSLTAKGRIYGLCVLRRHRILETFLASVLHFDWTDIHEEAENLEHAASEKLIDALDAYLKYPKKDPHGDPIPAKGQKEYTIDDSPVSTFDTGSYLEVTRIDGNRTALIYYQKEGLIPGAKVHVLNKEAETGLMSLSIHGKDVQFALSALEGVFAEEDKKAFTVSKKRE